MDEFDKQVKEYKKIHPRVGYSRMALEEAYDMSTTEGYFKRKEKKMNEKENTFVKKLIMENCGN